jgi:alanyl-tRNA synthetase
LPPTEFVRETWEMPVAVARVIERDGQQELVFDRTPFYAESGGQVGDSGVLLDPESHERVGTVEYTYRPAPGATVHRVQMARAVKEGETLIARVASEPREATMRNHTATHLLHASLRTVLGPHVKQAGSVVDPSRLRFDFTHYAAVDPEELAEIERLMNKEILGNVEVNTNVMDLEHALNTGAMALFGEKYGAEVRVVEVPGFSKELCGGTHVHRTGDIGICKIVYEGSISAGVRRIEAITGEEAVRRFRDTADALDRVERLVNATKPEETVEHVEKLLLAQRALEKQINEMKLQIAQAQASRLESDVREINGVKVLAGRVDGLDRVQLRALTDSLRNKWRTAVVVLASAENGNVSIVSAVTKDLTAKVHAGKLLGAVAQAVGGKGGGRPDLAEGGGKDASALPGALADVYTRVESMLG